MDIYYCKNHCPIGKAARKVFLDLNDSVFAADAAIGDFIVHCFSRCCPFKKVHNTVGQNKGDI